MIQEILKKLGFNDKEAEIYIEVLKLGRATPARISKSTGINRTTIYSSYKKLVKKGVLVEDLGHKYTYLIALPPENLRGILDHKKSVSKKRRNLLIKRLLKFLIFPPILNSQFPK